MGIDCVYTRKTSFPFQFLLPVNSFLWYPLYISNMNRKVGRRMKKKLVIILSLVLVMALLAGCSRVELGYLNMSSQVSAAEEFQASGTVTGEIDFDAMAVMADQTMAKVKANDSSIDYSEGQAKDTLNEMGLTGTKKIQIDYDMLANRKNSMTVWADFDVTFNGKHYEMGDLYFDATKGIFISKNLLIGLYDFYKDFSPNKWDSYFYSEEYRNGLLKAFGDSDYISMEYLDDSNPELAINIQTFQTTNKEMNEAAVKFISAAFSGFTTDTVTPVSGGYKVSLDGKQGKKLIADVLQYSIDKVMDAYKDFSTVLIENMANMTEEEKQEAKAEIEDLLGPNSQIMASSYLAMARQGFLETDKAGYLDFLNGFKYSTTMKKSGNKYTTQEDMSLTHRNQSVCSIKTQGEIKLQPVYIQMPASGTSYETVQDAVTTLENQYNPITNAELTWWNSDYGSEESTIWIDYTRGKESPLAGSSNSSSESYFIKDNRLYVPVRSISEGLGEQVTWDKNAKKVYVSHGGKQIEMTGIVKGGVTYIKLIDFEKLGYQVSHEYEKDWGMHTAKITKL